MAAEQKSQYEQTEYEERHPLAARFMPLYEYLADAIDKVVYRTSDLKQTNMNMGREMLDAGKAFDAMLRFRVAAWITPSSPDAWYYLGLAQLERDHIDKAVAAFKKALSVAPRFNDAIYMLDMLNRLPDKRMHPKATPIAVIKRQFNNMAPMYNDMQLGEMDYNGHIVVRDAFIEHVKTDKEDIHILDLGCGTGLCGEFLRSDTATMTGLDISTAMLEIASTLHDDEGGQKIYDNLVHAEARNYLHHQTPVTFDVIIAGNLLNYFGDISPFLKGAKRSLSPGGYFIFTTEKGGDTGYNFDRERMLFFHSEDYLRTQLKNSGLELIDLSMAEIYEHEPGWCVTCRAPA